jgi:3',5'-cyclic AMP phosphodiesterase CpdA
MGRAPSRPIAPNNKVTRYAHPHAFANSVIEKSSGLEDWSKQNLGPVPAPRAATKGRFSLDDIIGANDVAEINQIGELRFQSLGDSGTAAGIEHAEEVAEEMASDFKAGADALNPAFLFHLGDVVYGARKAEHYVERFYSPYRHYLGKIIAIPGNHDGEVRSDADSPSLKDFQANFCAAAPAVPAQAKNAGIYRETMTQPGPYWLLDAPFVRIIGLYSNRIENPGFLQGKTENGNPDLSQIEWLTDTLKDIKQSGQQKALIVATHHPPYSYGHHGGSRTMRADLDTAFAAAGLWPDLFLSGHSHNYQRFTRRKGGRQIPYIVAGTGGMAPQPVPAATGQPVEGTNDATYDVSLKAYGYLYVTVSKAQLKVEFWEKGDEHIKPFDSVTVNLANGVLS